MSLAKNTRRLLREDPTDRLETDSSGNFTTLYSPVLIEYQFLSGRELYDKTIIAVDRHHTSAGEWAVRGKGDFYQVRVISRPVYALPQALSLRFRCFWDSETVASEYLSLLSVFAREPLLPVGVRRMDDTPILLPAPYKYPVRGRRAEKSRPVGIDSHELGKILEGMAASADEEVDAALAAARFYQAGLSLLDFDRSIAYVSLVSAIETLAGRYYRGWKPTFEEVQKVSDRFGPFLNELSAIPAASHLAEPLKKLLTENEHLPTQKFIRFVTDHLPRLFWETNDDLYPDYGKIFPIAGEPDLTRRLGALYKARSRYVHAGVPFPQYVEFGVRETYPAGGFAELQGLPDQPSYVAPLFWFERVVHLVVVEYLRRTFAVDLNRSVAERRKQNDDLVALMKALPEETQNSLRKLAEWTRQWLGFAVMNPMAPNKLWAENSETVEVLRDTGLIRVVGSAGFDGSAYLKNRQVGEAVGEFVFGAATNPFRDCEILLPKEFEDANS